MLPSEYEDNTLQNKEKSTERTVPFFVQEVTARSVTNILGIQPNSTILFCRKIRIVISYHSALTADGVLRALSSWKKAISDDTAREDAVTVLQGSCCLRHSET